MILDAKEAKIDIAVKGFRAYDLFSGKFTVEDNASDTGIQRPAIFCKVPMHVLHEC
jgi:hypothetical protein